MQISTNGGGQFADGVIRNPEGATISILSAAGQLLMTTNEDYIDMSTQAAGMYIIRCNGQSIKVIKQ